MRTDIGSRLQQVNPIEFAKGEVLPILARFNGSPARLTLPLSGAQRTVVTQSASIFAAFTTCAQRASSDVL